MDDHSLRGYLERQTTRELESMLLYYSQVKNIENYEYAISEVFRVLQERNEQTAAKYKEKLSLRKVE